MTNKISQEKLQLLEEFNQKGFIQGNSTNYYRYIRDVLKLNPDTRYFKAVIAPVTRGGTKYSILDFFGYDGLFFIYDKQRASEFLDFLYSLFCTKNPTPKTPLRAAFHKLLSSNYLIPKDYHQRQRYEQKTTRT